MMDSEKKEKDPRKRKGWSIEDEKRFANDVFPILLKGKTYFESIILLDPELNDAEKILLILLYTFSFGEKTRSFYGLGTLGRILNKNRTTISKLLHSIEKRGYIRIARRGSGKEKKGKTNSYELLIKGIDVGNFTSQSSIDFGNIISQLGIDVGNFTTEQEEDIKSKKKKCIKSKKNKFRELVLDKKNPKENLKNIIWEKNKKIFPSNTYKKLSAYQQFFQILESKGIQNHIFPKLYKSVTEFNLSSGNSVKWLDILLDKAPKDTSSESENGYLVEAIRRGYWVSYFDSSNPTGICADCKATLFGNELYCLNCGSRISEEAGEKMKLSQQKSYEKKKRRKLKVAQNIENEELDEVSRRDYEERERKKLLGKKGEEDEIDKSKEEKSKGSVMKDDILPHPVFIKEEVSNKIYSICPNIECGTVITQFNSNNKCFKCGFTFTSWDSKMIEENTRIYNELYPDMYLPEEKERGSEDEKAAGISG